MSSDYNIQIEGSPQKYVTKVADDIINGNFFVGESENVLVADDGTAEIRKGYVMCGQRSEKYLPIIWSDTWLTNTNAERAFRSYADTLQVYFKNEWRTLMTGFGNKVKFCGDDIMDRNEQKDRFLFVNGTNKIFSWLGGIAEIESNTATTIKKANGLVAPISKIIGLATQPTGSKLSFGVATGNNLTGILNTIKGYDGFSSFYDAGFRDGDIIQIAGLSGAMAVNDGTYTILAVIPTTNEIIVTSTFGVSGIATAPQLVVIQGNTQGINSSETFAQARFGTSAGLKKFLLNGITYTYTAGENTDTLTGITPNLPATIPAGSLMFSSVESGIPAGGEVPSTFNLNWTSLVVARNQAYISSEDYRIGYLSKIDNFLDYNFTVPLRKSGDGGSFRLDKNIKALVVNDNDVVTASCGTSLIFDIWLEEQGGGIYSNLGQSIQTEIIKVKRIKASNGRGMLSQTSVGNSANGQIYLSTSFRVDYLTKIRQDTDKAESISLSEDIKPLLLNLSPEDAVALYHNSTWFILLKDKAMMLVLELERGQPIWQPPQRFNCNTMSVIENRLVIHSSITNESYFVFEGDTDDGEAIRAVFDINYKNGGDRTLLKTTDGFFLETKLSRPTTEAKVEFLYGYKGALGVSSEIFGADDEYPIVERATALPTTIGGAGIGQRNVGSFYTSENESIEYVKHRRIFPLISSGKEFVEIKAKIICDQKHARIKLVSYGFAMIPSYTHNSLFIKKIKNIIN